MENCDLCNSGFFFDTDNVTCIPCSTNCTLCENIDMCYECSGDNHPEPITDPVTNETRTICVPNNCPSTTYWDDG